MPVLDRLMNVGSMADSMGVYLPTKVIQKGLGMVRLLVFMYLTTRVQYDLWGLGMMIFTVAAPILTLGSNQALTRYVSLYEARRQLRAFCRRVSWCVPAAAATMTLLAFALSEPITKYAIVSHLPDPAVTYSQQRMICWAALANALMLALFHNLMGILYGMRMYRLVAVVELVWALIFTVLGCAALAVSPTGLAALVSHLASLVLTLGIGSALLHVALNRAGAGGGGLGVKPAAEAPPAPRAPEGPVAADTARPGEATAVVPLVEGGEMTGAMPVAAALRAGQPPGPLGAVGRVLRFGLVALVGTTLWNWAGFVSFWLTNRICGQAQGGVFHAFLSIGQAMVFLADAAWAVVFSHVARRWEGSDRRTAMFTLETAYKAIAMAMMTLTILVYVAAPLWVRILPVPYRDGQSLLGGLLLFFQVTIHLALMTILAKLHERPVVIALAGAMGIAVNLALGLWWMPGREAHAAAVSAALAAGVGIYVGAGAVTAAYLLAARVRLSPGTWFVLAAPAILLLPLWAAGTLWAGVCAAAVFTRLLFARGEKQLLANSALKVAAMARRVVSWR